MALKEDVVAAFERHYQSRPTVLVRAPGRVNLIGEHTDYNDGFVLPLAIDRAVWIALRPATDNQVRLYSLDFDAEEAFDLDVGAPQENGAGPGDWIEYVKGTAWSLKEAGYPLRGWEGTLAGDVPIGAGLSSSAALEMAAARAFAQVGDLPWDPPSMARLGQRAENRWVGVNCGIMDQMISASGQRDHALLLDCRSLEGQLVPLPEGVAVVVLDTGTRRGLVDSAYNERRAQCEAAAAFFGVPALRDVDADGFAGRMDQLDPTTRRRARHVIGENARTQEAARVMAAGDAQALGALMDASHVSLRDDFEVSSPALDTMVECARSEPGCYGARMTGAGFGGCAVALVESERAQIFVDQVAQCYRQASGETPRLYVCRATDGAAIL
ncbi:MAG: galactokinase [Candidatus Latescibacteria bacterium]|nr:galactokinase [Candidatus Latescibacterota bacterium]